MDINEKNIPLKQLGLNLGIILQKEPTDQLPDYEALQKQMETMQSTLNDINAEIKNINEKLGCGNSSMIVTIKNELDCLRNVIVSIGSTQQEYTGKMWSIGLDYTERGWCLCPCLREVRTASAIILDLNCDVHPSISGKNVFGDKKVSGPTVKFDIDPSLASGKDQKERTEWLLADSGSGFLVWDIDQDGKITSSKELFGNFDIDGEVKFEDGYKKLAHYFDKDKNGLISETELSELMIWTDSNADGITQPEELKSLSELGITCLDIRNINETEKSAEFKFTQLI